MIYYSALFITMWVVLEVGVAISGRKEEMEIPYLFLSKLLFSSVATLIFFVVVQVLSFILELLKEFNIV